MTALSESDPDSPGPPLPLVVSNLNNVVICDTSYLLTAGSATFDCPTRGGAVLSFFGSYIGHDTQVILNHINLYI